VNDALSAVAIDRARRREEKRVRWKIQQSDMMEGLPKVLRFSMDINSAFAENFLEKGGIDNKAVGEENS
jgi:hypothetical protein